MPVLVEDKLLRHGSIVLLLGDVLLLQHSVQNGLLTLFVEVTGGLNLSCLLIFHFQGTQGIILRGVVGNPDQAGTFRQGKLRNVLAKIGVRGGIHPVASLPQINVIEVRLQNIFLAVLFLKLQGAEYLHDLSLDGHLIVAGHVFNQLLGEGGPALDVLASKHQGYGLRRPDPVHAVVLIKTLVLNGHGGILKILGNLLDVHPNTVLSSIKVLGHFIGTCFRVFT